MKKYYLLAFLALFTLSSHELYGVKHGSEEEKKNPNSIKKTINKKDSKKSVVKKCQIEKLKRATQVLRKNQAPHLSGSTTFSVSFNLSQEGDESSSHSSSPIPMDLQDDDEVDPSFLQALDEIEAKHYSQQSVSLQAPDLDQEIFDDACIRAMEEIESSSSSQKSSSSQDPLDNSPQPLKAIRLVTEQDHTVFLMNTLKTATYQVMISSYNVSPHRFLNEGIGQAIIKAAQRGIKVYIYYGKSLPKCSKEEYAHIREVTSYCAKFEENANHSKCVVKDKDTVAIGSYNWLSDARENSSNGSMIVSGQLAPKLIDDVWQGIRFYQSLKYENIGGVVSFMKDRDAFSTGEYQFAPGQFLYTLRTPDAHGMLLEEVLAKAQKRVLLFSPFIRFDKLQRTLTYQRLQDLKRRGVNLTLTTLPTPCHNPREQREIDSYLDRLSRDFPNFLYKLDPNFHAKSLIADGGIGDVSALICEGSFNWLSAVDGIEHEANNFEMSVAVRGDIARTLIQSFEQTDLGKTVTSVSRKKESQVKFESKKKSSKNEKKPAKRAMYETESDSQSPQSYKMTKTSIPASFDNNFKVFSGERYKISGYCVRFIEGDYLADGYGNTVYFETPEDAEQAAYDVLR